MIFCNGISVFSIEISRLAIRQLKFELIIDLENEITQNL